MAQFTYNGVTVHAADDVAARLPATFVATDAAPVEADAQPPVEADAQRVEQPVEQPDAVGVPKATASRGEWARYAESLGIEPGDMTKAELQAATATK